MRKMACWIFLLVILMGGCAPPQHPIAEADAVALVEAFLQDKVEGRFEAAEGRLIPRIRGTAWARTPEWTQWQVVKATAVAEGWLVETREYRTRAATPSASIMRGYYLVVRGDDGQRYIDMPDLRWGAEKGSGYQAVATTVQPDAANPTRRLVVTEGAATVLAEIEPNLPRTFRPYGAPPESLFGVGDSGWGAVALAPDLQSVAFVTRGTHPLLGVVDRSGKVRGLDLWFEGGAGELAWSFDGRYLAATNFSPRGIFTLHLWDLAAGRPVAVTGLPDGKDVSRLQWRDGTLQIRVGPERWRIDPATGEATRT